jgi:hypothetical protein
MIDTLLFTYNNTPSSEEIEDSPLFWHELPRKPSNDWDTWS